jgi:hypothetical protein
VHENKIINGNTLPPYNGISTIQLKSFINKVYVDLLSREANNKELDAATNLIKNANYSIAIRDSFVSSIINTQEFYTQLFIKTSGSVLNATSKKEVIDQVNFYNYLIGFNLQNKDTVSANALRVEVKKLENLRDADSLYALKQININEFYRRFILNYFYDEINMGSENYVKACFENLFYRLPTTYELSQGEGMVDGLNSKILFLQSGSSKGDFATIVTHCTAFNQGLITTAFVNYLLRKPNDTELSQYLISLSNNNDYTQLIKSILISKEYAGF